MQIKDTEWLTDYAEKIEHHEPYVEEWQEFVPESGHFDSDGNYVVDVHSHWETRTRYNPEKWLAITSEREFEITANEYKKYKQKWRKEKYIDLTHFNQRHHLGDGRGDMFEVHWTGDVDKIKPVTWKQTWENRVQASKDTVFQFPEVDEETKKLLFELPEPDQDHNTHAILGDGGPTQSTADETLMQWNAILGPRSENNYEKAARLWILVFKNTTPDIAYDQENYWKGGNKNELTLCIGVDSNYKIKWSHVISWTRSEKLKIDIRNFIQRNAGNSLELNAVVDFMGKETEDSFVRMKSSEFAYLDIQPPAWAIWTTWIVTIVLNIGISLYVCLNEFDKDNPQGFRGFRQFKFRRLR